MRRSSRLTATAAWSSGPTRSGRTGPCVPSTFSDRSCDSPSMKYTRVRETLTAGRAISRTGRVAADARATTFPSRSMIDTSYLGTGFMSNTPVTRTAKRGCVASVGLGVDVVADEGATGAAVAAAGLGDDALAGVGVVGAAGAG